MGVCQSNQAANPLGSRHAERGVVDPVLSCSPISTSPVIQIDMLNERYKRRLSVEHQEVSYSPEKHLSRTIYRQSSRVSQSSDVCRITS